MCIPFFFLFSFCIPCFPVNQNKPRGVISVISRWKAWREQKNRQKKTLGSQNFFSFPRSPGAHFWGGLTLEGWCPVLGNGRLGWFMTLVIAPWDMEDHEDHESHHERIWKVFLCMLVCNLLVILRLALALFSLPVRIFKSTISRKFKALRSIVKNHWSLNQIQLFVFGLVYGLVFCFGLLWLLGEEALGQWKRKLGPDGEATLRKPWFLTGENSYEFWFEYTYIYIHHFASQSLGFSSSQLHICFLRWKWSGNHQAWFLASCRSCWL